MTILDPSRLEFARHFDWYADKLDSLFRINETMVNGLGIIGAANVTTRFNFFQAISRFYAAAVLAEAPAVDHDTLRVIRTAAEHWSVTGEAYLVRRDRRISLIRPDYVFPIPSPYDREDIERYLFIYPFHNPTVDGFYDNELTTGTDRARVIEYDVASKTARIAIRKLQGNEVLDSPKGEAINIGEVFPIRSGESPYKSIESIVRELCIRLNTLQLSLNNTTLPLIQIDRGSITDTQLSGFKVSIEDLKRVANDPLGVTVDPPLTGEEGTRYVERTGSGLEESIEYIRLLLSQLGVLSGVPDYVFGLQLGRPNNETERVLFAAQARVNGFRLDLEDALDRMGKPVTFGSEPFITRRARVEVITQQIAAGIISPQEARDMLGYEGPPPAAPTQAPNPSPTNGNRNGTE